MTLIDDAILSLMRLNFLSALLARHVINEHGHISEIQMKCMTGMKNIRPIESLVQDDNLLEASIPFGLWGPRRMERNKNAYTACPVESITM